MRTGRLSGYWPYLDRMDHLRGTGRLYLP